MHAVAGRSLGNSSRMGQRIPVVHWSLQDLHSSSRISKEFAGLTVISDLVLGQTVTCQTCRWSCSKGFLAQLSVQY